MKIGESVRSIFKNKVKPYYGQVRLSKEKCRSTLKSLEGGN